MPTITGGPASGYIVTSYTGAQAYTKRMWTAIRWRNILLAGRG